MDTTYRPGDQFKVRSKAYTLRTFAVNIKVSGYTETYYGYLENDKGEKLRTTTVDIINANEVRDIELANMITMVLPLRNLRYQKIN
jgi:hypothetical protein